MNYEAAWLRNDVSPEVSRCKALLDTSPNYRVQVTEVAAGRGSGGLYVSKTTARTGIWLRYKSAILFSGLKRFDHEGAQTVNPKSDILFIRARGLLAK